MTNTINLSDLKQFFADAICEIEEIGIELGEVEARFILTDEEYNVGVFKTVS